MSFLLAKILVLMILAALLGAWLARVFLMRRYQDVTTEYIRMDSEGRAWRTGFEKSLAQRPEVDLAPLHLRLSELDATVRAIDMPSPVPIDLNPVLTAMSAIRFPTPTEVDLQPLHARLQELEATVRGIRIPTPKDVDLQPLHSRMDELEIAVRGIRIPVTVPTDLTPVLAAVSGIRFPAPKEVDLSGLRAQLLTLEDTVKAIRIPAMPALPAPVNLEPTEQRLAALERAVAAIAIPPSTTVDLSVVLQKLDRLEARAAQQAPAPASAPAASSAAPRASVRAGSRNLLSHAGFGKPDKLQLIKGVADVMEKMMHDIGVYYFWQIAEWAPADVAHADAQLTAFKGRIDRDNWIRQAVQFAKLKDAAVNPNLG